MRIAIVSTPRSGNTWFRFLLAHSLDLEQAAVHNIKDLPDVLPDRYVLQIHWMPTPDFLDFLEKHNFQVVSICRHPLDVLVSILQFAPQCPDTIRWLEGEGGNEKSIFESSPISNAFLEYCLSDRAKALLDVSPAWLRREDTTIIRYENLVYQTSVELRRLFKPLSVQPARGIEETIAKFTLENLKKDNKAHYWRGKVYSHVGFLTYDFASRIYRHHRESFEIMGYGLADKGSYPSSRQALKNWQSMAPGLLHESAQKPSKSLVLGNIKKLLSPKH